MKRDTPEPSWCPVILRSERELRQAHESLSEFVANPEPDDAAKASAISAFVEHGRKAGAMIDGARARWECQSILDYWSTMLYRLDRDPPDVTLLEFEPLLAPELDESSCPYRGLQEFRPEDSHFHFGHDRQIAAVERLLASERFVFVSGPSGSGKSSLVLAGVVPRVQRTAPDRWRVERFVPGSEPVQALRDALTRGEAAAKLLLVIDQFEELFTLGANLAQQSQFAEDLHAAIHGSDRVYAVATIRADYEARVAALSKLQPYLDRSNVRATPLGAAELRAAILRPAEQVGLHFDDGVVEHLIEDIVGEPAGLPLLQFALMALWQRRERNRITRPAYESLGGVRGALGHLADEMFEKLPVEQQTTARRILLRLVQPSEGLEVTRNRVSRKSLYASGEARDRVDRVLARLTEARLVRAVHAEGGEPRIEVVHEALIRNWPRFVEWLEESREELRSRRSLTQSAADWVRVNRDPSSLLRGAALESAKSFADLDELESEFVHASDAARRRANSRRRLLIAGAFSALVLALIAASVIALWAWNWAVEAEKQKKLAEAASRTAEDERLDAESAREAAEKAKREADEQRDLAENARSEEASQRHAAQASASQLETALAAEAAATREARTQARQALIQAELRRFAEERLRKAAEIENTRLEREAETSRRETVASRARTLCKDSEILFRSDPELAFVLARLAYDLVPEPRPPEVILAVRRARLATISPSVLSGHNDRVLSARFDATTTRILTACEDGFVRIWPLRPGEDLIPSRSIAKWELAHDGPVYAARFALSGAAALTSGADGAVRLWFLREPTPQDAPPNVELGRHDGPAYVMATADDQPVAATGGRDGTVKVFDLETRTEISTLEVDAGTITGLDLSPDGGLVVAATSSGSCVLWNYETKERLAELSNLPAIIDVRFRSSDTVLLATENGDVSEWIPGEGRKRNTLWTHPGGLRCVAYSSDSERVMTSFLEGSAIIHSKVKGQDRDNIVRIAGHSGTILHATFSPSDRWLATASTDQTVRLWEATTGDLVAVLDDHVRPVSFVEFSKDEQWLATASDDRTAFRYSIASLSASMCQLLENSPDRVLDGPEKSEFTPWEKTDESTPRETDDK